ISRARPWEPSCRASRARVKNCAKSLAPEQGRKPSVDCTLDRHLLDGYLDGELGFERALEVEAHAASCRSCARELESWKEIRGALTRSDLYYRAPAALEEKIRRLAPRDPVAVRAPWLSRFTWAASGAAFATAILLLAFVTTYRGRPATDQVVGAGFVESHIRSLM